MSICANLRAPNRTGITFCWTWQLKGFWVINYLENWRAEENNQQNTPLHKNNVTKNKTHAHKGSRQIISKSWSSVFFSKNFKGENRVEIYSKNCDFFFFKKRPIKGKKKTPLLCKCYYGAGKMGCKRQSDAESSLSYLQRTDPDWVALVIYFAYSFFALIVFRQETYRVGHGN